MFVKIGPDSLAQHQNVGLGLCSCRHII